MSQWEGDKEVGLAPGQSSGDVGGQQVQRPPGSDVSTVYNPNEAVPAGGEAKVTFISDNMRTTYYLPGQGWGETVAKLRQVPGAQVSSSTNASGVRTEQITFREQAAIQQEPSYQQASIQQRQLQSSTYATGGSQLSLPFNQMFQLPFQKTISPMEVYPISAEQQASIQKAQYAEKWYEELPLSKKILLTANEELQNVVSNPIDIIFGTQKTRSLKVYESYKGAQASYKEHGYYGGFAETLLQNEAFQITAVAATFGAGLGLVSKIPRVGALAATGIGIGAAGSGVLDVVSQIQKGNIREAAISGVEFIASAPFAGAGFKSVGGEFVKLPSIEKISDITSPQKVSPPEGLLPEKAIKFQAGAELALELSKSSPPIERPLDFTKIKALGEFGSEVESFVRTIPEQQPVIGGSAAAYTQFKGARLPGDIDIDVLRPEEAARALYPKAKEFFGAENVKLDINKQFGQATIEIYGKHGIQFIPKTPVGAEIGQHTGLPFESKPPIEIEGIKYKAAPELIFRKADSILRQQGETIAPQSHRVKDIYDFEKMSSEILAVKESKAESSWFMKESKLEKVHSLESKLQTYKMYSGLDPYPAAEAYSRILVRHPEFIPGLTFPYLSSRATVKDERYIPFSGTKTSEYEMPKFEQPKYEQSSYKQPTDKKYPTIVGVSKEDVPYVPTYKIPDYPIYDTPTYQPPYKSTYKPFYEPPYTPDYPHTITFPTGHLIDEIEKFPRLPNLLTEINIGKKERRVKRKIAAYQIRNPFPTLEDIISVPTTSKKSSSKRKNSFAMPEFKLPEFNFEASRKTSYKKLRRRK